MRIDGRLKRLEARREQGRPRLSREALGHLSDGDLDALEDALEAGQENGSATFEELYRVVTESGRRALGAYFDVLETLESGEEPRVSPQAGEEGTRRSRNGYRIWKYRK